MALPDLTCFHVARDPRGVVAAALDVPGRKHNVLGEQVFLEFETLLHWLEHDPAVRLVRFESGKESGFLAGADLRELYALGSREAAERLGGLGQRLFHRLERFPLPTVAVIHGPCLGGGLEFALACRYRVARDDDRTRLGLPEVGLGLVSAWGGTQRLPRRIGLSAALPMILDGTQLSAAQALQLGLVDGAWAAGRFAEGVERFVSDRLEQKPLPRRRPRLLARLRDDTRLGRAMLLWAARRRIAPRSRDCPALAAALDAVEQGLRRSPEAGFAGERAAFAELLMTPICRNLIGQFLHRQPAPK
jgi:3-hydroxyacyl-CoA dehydrogenase / enoyl-CoA hydratase / 3-hydroxybutyryl-CoA epimerase